MPEFIVVGDRTLRIKGRKPRTQTLDIVVSARDEGKARKIVIRSGELREEQIKLTDKATPSRLQDNAFNRLVNKHGIISGARPLLQAGLDLHTEEDLDRALKKMRGTQTNVTNFTMAKATQGLPIKRNPDLTQLRRASPRRAAEIEAGIGLRRKGTFKP